MGVIQTASVAEMHEAVRLSRRRFLKGISALGIAGLAIPRLGHALLPVGGSFAASQFAPNRPAGLSVIVDRQWNPTDGTIPGGVLPPATLTGMDSTGMTWASNDTGGTLTATQTKPVIDTIANINSTFGTSMPALPDGHATAMAVQYVSGFPAGFRPFACSTGPAGGLCQKLYIAAWINYPSSTLMNSNGNNIKFVSYQNTAPVSNHIAMLSSGGISDYRATWMVLQTNWGGSGSYGGQSSNAPGAITSLAIPPPQGTGPGWISSYYNQWVCHEWYMQTESVPGVTSDGIFWGAMAGTVVNYWTNIRYNAASGDANGFNLVSLIPYFGGGGSAATGQEVFGMGRFLAAAA